MTRLHRHKHAILLLVTLAGLALQPMTHRVSFGVVVYEVISYLLLIAVFLGVFERHREKAVALALGALILGANIAAQIPGPHEMAATLVYHASCVLFLALAVAVILRGVFRSVQIGTDELLGAFSGYVFAGIAWGNVYVLIHLLEPDAFLIADGLAWQLTGDDSRRFLFNYFSFATLTTVGYGDVTPLAPAACAFAWFEAVFGQFYTAVFVGQLIGLKLAAARDATIE